MSAKKHRSRGDKLRDIGVVYVVYDKARCLSKIGMTCEKNPQKRVNIIKSQSGVKDAEIWISQKTKNARRLEHKTHQKFDCKRQHGEWFSVSLEEVVCCINENIECVSKEYCIEKEVEAKLENEASLEAMKNLVSTSFKNEKREDRCRFSPIKSMWCNWILCKDMEPPKIHGFEILADIGEKGCHNPIALSYNKRDERWECDLGFACFEVKEQIIEAWMPVVFPDEFEAVCQAAAS